MSGNEMSRSEAEAYCRCALGERRKVETVWGATWTDPIRVHVNSEIRISKALVPGHFGDRGPVEMPLSRARVNTGALLHEIVHVCAPHANRFLAEGLAVYLHARLAANREFRNFGADPSVLAARNVAAVASLQPLHAVPTPQPLE